ncbi:MAG: glycosyltransferase family 2 protein [Lachnospiraceae bacterium]
MTLDIIIPVYKPDEKLKKNLIALKKQTKKPDHIFLINTEEEFFPDEVRKLVLTMPNVSVTHIKKSEFDHGGTRNMGAKMSLADIIFFMTQDAIPANEKLVEEIITSFCDEKIAAVYARQMADKKKDFLEAFTRTFNYPKESQLKSKDDLEKLGIKTFFCSNVCAAYRRKVYEQLGGFPLKTIFNEDMIFASNLILAGYSIYYNANAKVWHWHHYTGMQQLRRNFDLAVSQVQYGGLFLEVKSESEGIRLVKKTISYVLKMGKWYLIPYIIYINGCKYIGYSLGKRYDKLPMKAVRWLSMNSHYWDNEENF